MRLFSILRAYLRRDWRTEASYGFIYYLSFIGVLESVLTYFFLDDLVPAGGKMSSYGGGYFPFVLVAYYVMALFEALAMQPAMMLRKEMVTGTLEHLVANEGGLGLWSLGVSVFPLMQALAMIAIMATASLFLGAEYSIRWLPLISISLASLLCFYALGLLATSAVLVFKRAGLVRAVGAGTAWLFSGAFFPLSVMPTSLQSLVWILPTTPAIEGARQALLPGSGEPGSPLWVLWAMTGALFPLAWLAHRYCFRWARARGSLAIF